MAASDAAFVTAMNQSRRGRLNEEAAVKQEERQTVLDERQDTLFNRSTTLFEQQQNLFKDEQAQKELGKELNAGLAMWLASNGQIFQPMMTAYEKIPDGGKMHKLSRNEDGTFTIDMEWQGERFTSSNTSYEDMSKMMMAIANPVQYLEQSEAAAAAEIEHNNKLEIARIRALKGRKAEIEKTFHGKLTNDQYFKWRKQFNEDYYKLYETDPELLDIPDASAEDGVRRVTMEEYQAKQFLTMGIDVSGLEADDKGSLVDRTPPDPRTASFRDVQKFLIDSGRVKQGSEVDAAIEVFISSGRADELLKKIGGSLTPSQKRRLEAGSTASKAGSSKEADAKDAEQAAIIVRDNNKNDDKKATGTEKKQGVIPDGYTEDGLRINPETGKPYPLNAFYERAVKPVFKKLDEHNAATSGRKVG